MVQDAHENKQASVIACSVIMMSLAGIAVALRLFVRLRFDVRQTSRAGLWYDDYAIIVALLFSYGMTAGFLVGKKMIDHDSHFH